MAEVSSKRKIKLTTIWSYIKCRKISSLENVLCCYSTIVQPYDLATCIIKMATESDNSNDSEEERIFYLLCSTWILLVIKDTYIQDGFKENDTYHLTVPFKPMDFIANWFNSVFKTIGEHFTEEKPIFKNLINLLLIPPKEITCTMIKKYWPVYFANGTLLYGIREKALLENDPIVLMIFNKHNEKAYCTYSNSSTIIFKEIESNNSRRGWKRSANGNIQLKRSIKVYKAEDFILHITTQKGRPIKIDYFSSIVEITRTLIGMLHSVVVNKILTWICRKKMHNYHWEVPLMHICLKLHHITFDLSVISIETLTNTLYFLRSRKIWHSVYHNLLVLAVKSGFYLDLLEIAEEDFLQIAAYFQCPIEELLTECSYYRFMYKLNRIVSPLSLRTIAIYNIRKHIKPPFTLNLKRLRDFNIPPQTLAFIDVYKAQNNTIGNNGNKNDIVCSSNSNQLRSNNNKIFTII